MIIDVKVGEVTLYGVELKIIDEGDFRFIVPNCIGMHDPRITHIQQITDKGLGDPVLKTDLQTTLSQLAGVL